MRFFAALLLLLPGVARADQIYVEATPIPMVTALATAVPTAWATPQFGNTAPLRSVSVDNASGSSEIWCRYGIPATPAPHFAVPAGSVYTDNLGARGQKMSSSIGCMNPAQNTPSTGTVKIYGSK